MAEKLEAIILDWAGTTMDHGCYAPAVVFQQVFEAAGVPISIEEARAPMGAHKKVHIRKITQLPEVQKRWRDTHGREPCEEDVEKMFEQFVPAQMACLADYADLIPGTLDAIKEFRNMGLKIGSTTGYTGDMMKILLAEAQKRGYTPDVSVCSTGHYAVRNKDTYDYGHIRGIGADWNISRPLPHMCNLNAALLGVSKPYLCVKVGDTIPDIEEGRNAGMWTIGLAITGNEMGLREEEIRNLPPDEYERRKQNAYYRMYYAGADVIVDGIEKVPRALTKIMDMALESGAWP